MNKVNLVPLLSELKQSVREYQYTALPTGAVPNSFVAVDREGRTSVLFLAAEKQPALNLGTDLISLKLGCEGTMFIPGQSPLSGKFHVLQCLVEDADVTGTFVVLVEALLNRSTAIKSNELVTFFQSLVRLFRITPCPDLSSERQGLWGELFVMRTTGDIKSWMKRWHGDPVMKFDFASSHRRVEVKTSVGVERIHTFSHQQLTAIGKEITIASLLVRQDDAGLSLRDLIAEVRQAVDDDPELLAKLEASIRRAGMQEPSEQGPVYDEQEASVNLKWYRSADVPKWDGPEPPGITDTRYRCDLSVTQPLLASDSKGWLALFLEEEIAHFE